MSDQELTREYLETLDKKELQALCKERELSVSGNKGALTARLLGEEVTETKSENKAQLVNQNLIIREISVRDNTIIFGVAGELVVEMNDQKQEFMAKSSGTPIEVRLK